ncbi:hypothetical protein ACO0K0_05390 [Undibacterium sp. SXout11W]|uniref:hypothetical protein n=1 Tax=Undibacterium sp. SXout11W TaxID=3413050 RepID=UPI003BEFDE06
MRVCLMSTYGVLPIFIALTCVPITSNAEPAAYFIWKSKTSDAQLCAQTSPGEFWEKGNVAFKDPHCEKPKSSDAMPQLPLILVIPPVKVQQ